MTYKELSKKIPGWIEKGIDNDTNTWAEELGKELAKGGVNQETGKKQTAMTMSQLRRFFGEIKRIEMDFENNKQSVFMLKPMLAYATGRDTKNTKIDVFHAEIRQALEEVTKNVTKERFSNFVKLIEAIVAYHKFYGGK